MLIQVLALITSQGKHVSRLTSWLRSSATSHGGSILSATNDVLHLGYRPRTAQTMEVYSLILTLVYTVLGDVSQLAVRPAPNAILEILMDEDHSGGGLGKKRGIDDILEENIPNHKFTDLVNPSKKINHSNAGHQYEQMDERGDGTGAMGLDEREGVAVVFGNED